MNILKLYNSEDLEYEHINITIIYGTVNKILLVVFKLKFGAIDAEDI